MRKHRDKIPCSQQTFHGNLIELSWDFLCFFLVWQTILCYDFDKSGFVEVIKISMIEVSDDAKIIDIQRVAHMLNCNRISLEEYLNNGGHYSR